MPSRECRARGCSARPEAGADRCAKHRATATTQRMRKLECDRDGCPNIAYQSRAAIARGLMSCPCGGTLIPATLEDAALVLPPEELAQHPEAIAYEQQRVSIEHGRAPAAHDFGEELRLRHAKSRDARLTVEELAAQRIAAERRERARAARLNALAAHVAPVAAVPDPIPF